MGIYACSLGNKRTRLEEQPSYFQSPHFVYFQMFVILILITNIILFSLTFSRINDVFRNKKKNLKAQEKDEEKMKMNIQEFKICLYFLFISGREYLFFLR